MEALQILNRNEMKMIKGGGSCRVYGSNGWSSCSHSPSEAAEWYNDFGSITGYCCASCGTGDFSNAAPCGPGNVE